jgi:hypothetical protein
MQPTFGDRNHGRKHSKNRSKKHDEIPVTAVPRPSTKPAPSSRWRGPMFLLGVTVAAAVTWAATSAMVHWVWNPWSPIPPELVGKWVVEGGPQDGATFDFNRTGSMKANLNGQGVTGIMNGTVAVEDKSLLVTTQNPYTKENETRSAIIRELTAYSLVVEFDKNEVLRMARAK